MRLSVVIPFQRGREFLKDCFDSIREQRMRVYLDNLEGKPGFERLDRLENMKFIEGKEEVWELLKNGDLTGLEGLKNIRGRRDILPFLPAEETTDESGEDEQNILADSDGEPVEAADMSEGSDDSESDESRPFIYVPYRDFEVVLVLDHPVDDVEDIIGEYSGDFDISVFTLPGERTGVAAARNFGTDKACGDYVIFMDSDDYLFPRALYFMDKAILAGEEPDVVYGKKVWTWYSRSGFLALFEQKKAEKQKETERLLKLGEEEFPILRKVIAELNTTAEQALETESIQRKLRRKYNRYAQNRIPEVEAEIAVLQARMEAERAENEGREATEGTADGQREEEALLLPPRVLDAVGFTKLLKLYIKNHDGISYADDSEEDDSEADAAADEGEELGDASDEDEEKARLLEEERLALAMSPEEYAVFYAQRELDRARRRAVKRLIAKRKGIRNVSVLNIAIKRSFIAEQKLSFREDFRYYSDLPYVCEMVEKAGTFRKNYKTKYVKRKHSDPINFPSLAQEKSDNRFAELVESYKYARTFLSEEGDVIPKLDQKIINYYTNYYVTRLRRSEREEWRNERFGMMREAITPIPRDRISHYRLYKRRLIKALKKGNLKKTYRIVSVKLGVKKLLKCMRSRAEIIRSFYIHVFLKQKLRKDYVLFECFFGKSYGDNPKGIYEYMAKNCADKYTLVWSMQKGVKCDIPYKHRTVTRFGLRYAYYIARSKYFVFNTKQPKWMRKREGQVFLETWHGTPLKRLAFDMDDNFSAAPSYKKQIYSNTRSWDYLVAANKFSSDIFRSCFMFEGNMLEYGYPRNDILHRPDRDVLAAGIRKKLGIPANRKTILYAPTWRDDEFYAAGQYKFTLKLELPKLKEALEGEYVILLRTHYYIADKLDVTGMDGFAYNLSNYPDIADIYLISDICITDYSSVFFDYANLRRPMLFYTYDIDKYRDMLRGFYFDMESTVPGPLLYTTEEVIDAIRDIDGISAKFADRYDAFYEKFCSWEDGHASENIVNEVFTE